MHVFLIFDDAPNLVHSFCIWTASLGVGANTNTIGPSPGTEKYNGDQQNIFPEIDKI